MNHCAFAFFFHHPFTLNGLALHTVVCFAFHFCFDVIPISIPCFINHPSIWISGQFIAVPLGDKQPFTLTITPTDNSEFPIHGTRMFLDCGRKPENREKMPTPHSEVPGL